MKIRSIIILILSITSLACNDSNRPIKQFGKGYNLIYDTWGYVSLVDSNHTYIVEGPIIKYFYNYQYITIKNKPFYKIYKNYGLDKSDLRFDDMKSMFNIIQYYDFWIIDKKIDSVYGPYQKEEFLNKFKELKLPDSLRIE